jgi:sortase A
VRFSFRQHIVPPILGFGVMVLMYGVLNFPLLQAQSMHYISRYMPSQATSAVPSAAVAPSNKSQLTIASIGVKAPIIFEPSTNNSNIDYALRSGVVHYGSTALPGEQGSVAIFGHSSGLAWAPGDYKFVFTLLEKLKIGDSILLDYKGVRYIYEVSGSEVVRPTDMAVLKQTDKSELLLITCTPVGTSQSRLVIHAKQLRPSPENNKVRPVPAANPAAVLPGN